MSVNGQICVKRHKELSYQQMYFFVFLYLLFQYPVVTLVVILWCFLFV